MDERRPGGGMRMPAATAIDLAVWLDQVVGPMWRPVPSGSVPGVELVARFVDDELGRRVLAGVLLLGDPITAEQLRKVPLAALENEANAGSDVYRAARKLPPLERGQLSPEDFSRLVAQHYKVWAKHLPHPVAAIAAQWKVNPATVHPGSGVARRRGFLPPATRGKRGKGSRS